MANPHERKDRPFSNTAIAKYLDEKLEQMKGTKTQREIAEDLGYKTPNLISMFRRGDCKIPIDKIPLLATSLQVDVGHLLRLGLEQYMEGFGDVIIKVFGHIATVNEERLFLREWRLATNNMDPEPTERMEDIARVMLVQVRGAL